MVNLSKLQDIEPLNISANLTDPDILNTAVSSANDITNGYLGLGISIAIYIFTLYIATKAESGFSLDFIKASVLASGVSIVVGLLLLTLDITSSFSHLMLFVVIFVLSVLMSYILKDKE